MPISFVGAQSAVGTSLTIPTHQNGDLIIMFAFRDGSTTLPGLPATWISITSLTGSTSASRLAYKVATTNAETSGTWTSFTELVCHVYRGTSTSKAPVAISRATSNGSTSTTIAFNNSATSTPLAVTDNRDSWVAGFMGHRTATDLNQVPSGSFTNRTSVSGAGGFDSNGIMKTVVDGLTVGVNANSGWKSHMVEIFSEKQTFQNYMSVGAGDGMSVGEKTR